MKMQFIPTIINNLEPPLNFFFTSISHHEKQRASIAHPPLAKTNDEVAIFLIIGVIFSQSRPYPIARPATPAIERYVNFWFTVLLLISSFPHSTPQTV